MYSNQERGDSGQLHDVASMDTESQVGTFLYVHPALIHPQQVMYSQSYIVPGYYHQLQYQQQHPEVTMVEPMTHPPPNHPSYHPVPTSNSAAARPPPPLNPSAPSFKNSRIPQTRMCKEDDRSNRVVWVGNLPPTTDDRSLRAYFLSIGGIGISALNHLKSNQTAFIQLETSQEVPEFIRIFDGCWLMGYQLTCVFGKPQSAAAATHKYKSQSHMKHFFPRQLALNQHQSQQHEQEQYQPELHSHHRQQHQQQYVFPLPSATMHAPPLQARLNNHHNPLVLNNHNQQLQHCPPASPAKKPRDFYFIMKAYTQSDICISQIHSVWSTNPKNEARLNKSYSRATSASTTANGYHGNVYLLFSVNGSGGIAGMARMEAYAGNGLLLEAAGGLETVIEELDGDEHQQRQQQQQHVVNDDQLSGSIASLNISDNSNSNDDEDTATTTTTAIDEETQSKLLPSTTLMDIPTRQLWDSPFPVKWLHTQFVPFHEFNVNLCSWLISFLK
ncbi:UNVERIFIED_CONTAM: hypothetical protein HDU68_009798 [Siphonaria sp. JEL0065]|nr:hypothetical protein HDU68_009798 [Siphonaria sp. JEL0065]